MTSHVQLPEPTAEIIAVQDDLVTLSPLGDAPLIKNEVVYIIPARTGTGRQAAGISEGRGAACARHVRRGPGV